MSTLEERIADVIRAIAFEFKKSKETTNSGIDTKTLNRIMRCVHAWEKTVDTDKDGVTDYDEYEVNKTDPNKMDKVELPKDTNGTGDYDIRVKEFQFTPESNISLTFELTENGSPVYLNNETPYTLISWGEEKLSASFEGGGLCYKGRYKDPIDVSIEFKGVTTNRKFTYGGGTFVLDTRSNQR